MSDAAGKEPLSLMVKPVGSRCNMRCRYCYYLEKGRYSAHQKQTRMSYDLLERVLRQYFEAAPGPVLSVTWHGGEPTLAGLDFFKKAVEIEKKYLPRGFQLWNSLQTNGLLLNDAWCAFLRENRFDVGLSIDGDRLVHDQNRRDLGGSGTYDRAAGACGRLRRAGLQPDLLCTVNAASAERPLEVYRGLRELGTGWAQFIPIVVRRPDGSLSPESVTPEGYGDFLIAAFDEWTTHDLGTMDVQLFAEISRVLAGGQASVCTLRPTCGRVLVAEEDGAVYACDHFVDPEHRLGNAARRKLGDLAESEGQRRFGDQKRDQLTAQCRRCPWLELCNGGCPKDRFGVSQDGEPGQYVLCPGLRRFFAHAEPRLRRMMELSGRGVGNGEIMREMRTGHGP